MFLECTFGPASSGRWKKFEKSGCCHPITGKWLKFLTCRHYILRIGTAVQHRLIFIWLEWLNTTTHLYFWYPPYLIIQSYCTAYQSCNLSSLLWRSTTSLSLTALCLQCFSIWNSYCCCCTLKCLALPYWFLLGLSFSLGFCHPRFIVGFVIVGVYIIGISGVIIHNVLSHFL